MFGRIKFPEFSRFSLSCTNTEYRGRFLLPWRNFMIHVRDIISTVGMFTNPTFFTLGTMGRYHDTCMGDVKYPPPPPPYKVLNISSPKHQTDQTSNGVNIRINHLQVLKILTFLTSFHLF